MSETCKRILVADDNPQVRESLLRLFHGHKFLEICSEAVDGRDAINKAVELKPDLIILDLSMPVMNGLEAARHLKEIMPGVPMILFTLHSQAVLQADVEAAGIRRVVRKTAMCDLLSCTEELLLAA